MASGGISNIISSINAGGGIAKPTHYQVDIMVGSGGLRGMSALIKGAGLPGKSFQTATRSTYGSTRKMPTLTTYQDFQISILCTGNMGERKFFDGWMNYICNVNSGYFSYYDNYVGLVQISQLNDMGNQTYAIVLEEAYPVTITEQKLGYDDHGGALSLDVSFAYHKWRNNQQMYDDTGSGTGKGLATWPISDVTADTHGTAQDTGYFLAEGARTLSGLIPNGSNEQIGLGTPGPGTGAAGPAVEVVNVTPADYLANPNM